MLKDILLPTNVDAGVAIVKELNTELDIEWYVYVVNYTEFKITNVFVTCKGYGVINGEEKHTTVIRYFLDDIEAQTAIKVEPIHPDLFALNNEYFLTFFLDGEIHDKKIVFAAESIDDSKLEMISIVERLGLYIQ